MIKIGSYNNLYVARFVDFGLYLTGKPVSSKEQFDCQRSKSDDILLPAKYIPVDTKIGDVMRVFVYTDGEDRPIATTERPYAVVGDFAYLQVVDVNQVGAFLDWGLPKHLLVPYSEQKMKMRAGGIYLVYVYLDPVTNRVVASAKIDKFLGNVYPDYKEHQKVHAMIIGKTDIGYQAIVNNRHKGMIYENELYSPLEIEETVTAYVKNIREDGKIDLTLTMPGTFNRVDRLGEVILSMVKRGTFTLTDRSDPEDIKNILHCSKKDFKRTVGALYKSRKILIAEDGTIMPA